VVSGKQFIVAILGSVHDLHSLRSLHEERYPPLCLSKRKEEIRLFS
jgi:hypothetical protein